MGRGTGGGGTRASVVLAGRSLEGGGGGTVRRRGVTCKQRDELMTSASSSALNSPGSAPSAAGPRANTCSGVATRGDREREASGRPALSPLAICTGLLRSYRQSLEAEKGWLQRLRSRRMPTAAADAHAMPTQRRRAHLQTIAACRLSMPTCRRRRLALVQAKHANVPVRHAMQGGQAAEQAC